MFVVMLCFGLGVGRLASRFDWMAVLLEGRVLFLISLGFSDSFNSGDHFLESWLCCFGSHVVYWVLDDSLTKLSLCPTYSYKVITTYLCLLYRAGLAYRSPMA